MPAKLATCGACACAGDSAGLTGAVSRATTVEGAASRIQGPSCLRRACSSAVGSPVRSTTTSCPSQPPHATLAALSGLLLLGEPDRAIAAEVSLGGILDAILAATARRHARDPLDDGPILVTRGLDPTSRRRLLGVGRLGGSAAAAAAAAAATVAPVHVGVAVGVVGGEAVLHDLLARVLVELLASLAVAQERLDDGQGRSDVGRRGSINPELVGVANRRRLEDDRVDHVHLGERIHA